jgi:uncharacterized protein YegP (UPF0339 family)
VIRHISALVALVALSLSSVACVAENEMDAAEAAESSQDLASQSAYFETFQGFDGKYYFHVMANNGQNVLRSEGYASLASADAGVDSLLANGTDAHNYAFETASTGETYFNVKAGNGETIGTSELYSTKGNAERGARTVRALVRLAREDKRITRAAAPRPEHFEIFTGEDNATYFRLRSNNGEILLGSEAYSSTSSARDGIASVQTNGSHADRFQVVAAADGGFTVRLVAANGEVIAHGEVYATKSNATRAVSRMTDILSGTVSIAD